MKIILVEFLWQAKEIINNNDIYKNDIIVSLNPESSYNLKANKINDLESYQICRHEDLWTKYPELTRRTIKITEALGSALLKTDERCKNLNWNLFNDYHYVLKISFDHFPREDS